MAPKCALGVFLPSDDKNLDVNRDKREAHLSLPHLHTKSTQAEEEEEAHWVLEIVW